MSPFGLDIDDGVSSQSTIGVEWSLTDRFSNKPAILSGGFGASSRSSLKLIGDFSGTLFSLLAGEACFDLGILKNYE